MSAPRVSDHALVRFLQRAGGLDVETLRDAIAQSLAKAHGAAVAIGGGDHLIVADGLTYVVRGGTVTTVVNHRSGRSSRETLVGANRRK